MRERALTRKSETTGGKEDADKPFKAPSRYEAPTAGQVRLQNMRYTLEGSNCGNCDVKHFPARPVCPDCGTF